MADYRKNFRVHPHDTEALVGCACRSNLRDDHDGGHSAGMRKWGQDLGDRCFEPRPLLEATEAQYMHSLQEEEEEGDATPPPTTAPYDPASDDFRAFEEALAAAGTPSFATRRDLPGEAPHFTPAIVATLMRITDVDAARGGGGATARAARRVKKLLRSLDWRAEELSEWQRGLCAAPTHYAERWQVAAAVGPVLDNDHRTPPQIEFSRSAI